ncbi:threonine/serine ThrE exporter family protein [Demequina sp.]|uniref:threonine/serine ThrE exporter family protein n=1 Tax=Demequina sp. TaxID=2050685 RepID=UPI003D0D54E6
MTDEPHPTTRELEEALEPVQLIEQSGAVVRTGLLMLSAGTASYRVKEAMSAVATSLGIDRPRYHVSFTDIAATSHRGRIFRTEVAENRVFAVNTDRIARLDRFRRDLPQRITAREVHAALDEIERRPPLYAGWLNAGAAGIACAAFAVLNHALPWEVLVVFIAALLGQLSRRVMAHRHFNAFGTVMAAAAVASLAYLGGIAIVNTTGEGLETHAAGYISSVLFLLPGFALITGALDMAKFDLRAGIERIAYGTMLTMAAGVSVWGVSAVANLDTAPRADADMPLAAHLALWAVASGIGVAGFALMFNSPWRLAGTAAVIGMVANTARLWAADAGMPLQGATALACLAVGCLAAFAARGGRWPVITLSVPSVLVMIPGVAAHEALVSLNQGDYADATAGILLVVLVVLSIMVGLVAAKLVTDKKWAFGNE